MKQATILIVDDKKANVYALSELIQDLDVRILTAYSGEECLSILLKDDVDIILLDIQMPNMDGFETARYIHGNKKTKKIPILFITAANQTDAINLEGYQHGAIDIIYKPIKEDILRMKIDMFLDLINTKRELEQQVDLLTTLNEQNKKMRERIEQLAMQDYLTKVGNRRKIDQDREQLYRHSYREKQPISFLMIDLDNFKGYNDHFGHTKGDSVLQQVAKAMQETVQRGLDTIGRYGGEEFMIVLPNTDEKGAATIAQNIIDAVVALDIKHSPNSHYDVMTISVGIAAEVPTDPYEHKKLLDKCDKALYEAKNSGKNKYCIYQEKT